MNGRVLGCVLLGVALVVGGCTGSDQPDGPTVSEQIERLEPEADVDLGSDEPPGDRDPDAVAAALWRLDPCKLITPAGGARLIDHSTPAPTPAPSTPTEASVRR